MPKTGTGRTSQCLCKLPVQIQKTEENNRFKSDRNENGIAGPENQSRFAVDRKTKLPTSPSQTIESKVLRTGTFIAECARLPAWSAPDGSLHTAVRSRFASNTSHQRASVFFLKPAKKSSARHGALDFRPGFCDPPFVRQSKGSPFGSHALFMARMFQPPFASL